MSYSFNPHARRVVKAKLGRRLGKMGQKLPLMVAAVLLVATAGALGEHLARFAELAGGFALMIGSLGLWLRWDIASLKAKEPAVGLPLEQMLEASLAARLPWPASPNDIWKASLPDWRASFILVRLGLHPELIEPDLSQNAASGEAVWTEAVELASRHDAQDLNAGLVVVALIKTEPKLQTTLSQMKLRPEDLETVYSWLERLLDLDRIEAPLYGGIGRDWAAGFTPSLDRFAANLSRQIQSGGHHFGSLAESPVVQQLITTLTGGTAGVALIGPPGAGKTSTVYALAQRLIEGDGGRLAYKQIYSLSASLIVSAGKQQGDIERIFLTILSEGIASGNIILALDEAQLFFSQGTGALDLGQILLPLVEGRRLPLILTLAPGDWQRLIATYPSLASALTPIMLKEPDEAHVIDVLADTALGLEMASHTVTQYEALTEAYRLAGRYLTEEAYPGRAIKLLELASNHPVGKLITASSVQQAVEGSLGVKVAQAQGPENSLLLNLEDRIHARMINQTRAVSVVASALRRARAGVANPKRPFGSFLFLGPTGVGKTELARSLAAIYYGGEANLTRLDLSEYQQPSDVERLLTADSPFLTAVRQQPFCVVLLDEIEKAHPNLLNLLLQLLDEGQVTDTKGRVVSFKDAIVIATSNAGADDIRRHIEAGEDLESFEQSFTDNLVNSGSFKPELLNRFDEIVLFRPLNEVELAQVVGLLIEEVNRTLTNQNIRVGLTDEAVAALVKEGYDPRLGARPMRRMVQRRVEDAVARKILSGTAHAGDTITLGLAEVGG
jgi:ATP-dependent Clp protease ATP-binding subunit ClpC